mmetsp:Transcript_16187/g.37430  ORF Transcript_16187/g.37430 Transcript_16187/m.37430 type:complete len:210 (+) Transcript_16187:108-737(+)
MNRIRSLSSQVACAVSTMTESTISVRHAPGRTLRPGAKPDVQTPTPLPPLSHPSPGTASSLFRTGELRALSCAALPHTTLASFLHAFTSNHRSAVAHPNENHRLFATTQACRRGEADSAEGLDVGQHGERLLHDVERLHRDSRVAGPGLALVVIEPGLHRKDVCVEGVVSQVIVVRALVYVLEAAKRVGGGAEHHGEHLVEALHPHATC